jgi:hypothetical protein
MEALVKVKPKSDDFELLRQAKDLIKSEILLKDSDVIEMEIFIEGKISSILI